MEAFLGTYEIISLQTLARIMRCDAQRMQFQSPAFNIYNRAYKDGTGEAIAFEISDVLLLSQPCWKLVWEDFLIDEYSHSDKCTVKGIECWPEFEGKYTVRNGGVADVDSDETFFLMGTDLNHYHMMLNFLPRIMLFERFYGDAGTMRFVVDEALSANAIRLLEIFGIPEDRLFRTKPNLAYRFRRAVVTSFFPAYEISPDVGRWLQSKCTGFRRPGQRKRVLLSREDVAGTSFGNGSQRRRIYNQAEVFDFLQTLDFEKYDFGRMTMDEQLEVVANSEFVIGPHGAGFANFACSGEGTKALVLENSWSHTFMADMLNVSGYPADIFQCEDYIDAPYEEARVNQSNYSEIKRNRDMIVPMNEFVEAVQDMVGN